MNKGMIVGVVAVVAIAAYAGVMALGQPTDDAMMKKDAMGSEEVMMEKEGMMVKDESATMEKDMMDKGDETMMKKEEMKKEDGAMMKEESGAMMDKEASGDMVKEVAMVKTPGTYEAYAPEKIARAADGKVVLFFQASWCPSCRALSADIESNRAAIPPGVTILKVDYDTATELKKRYGVTYQHTLVQVDKDGGLINKWSGSSTLAASLTSIK